ncbi:hypothetical protein [Subtercola endophyticus]|uniref:hypothetical protein n=1 Tax=Subtercola endophyticus TaxID=2895559 RepID=UPI001E2EDF13|nr:hypothetical protein [Subtercola endophyticus]UFS57631.1 hypothetical protein LQ955_11220 [Subtercola endophyticus]
MNRMKPTHRQRIAIFALLTLASVLVLSGCSNSVASGQTDIPCNDGSSETGAFDKNPTSAGSVPVSANPPGIWATSVVGQNDTILAGGRTEDWQDSVGESPAVVDRISGSSGVIITSASIDSAALKLPPAPVSTSTTSPIYDDVTAVAASPTRVYVLWRRYANDLAADSYLVSLDRCGLSIVAQQKLTGYDTTKGDLLAYDSKTNTVWVPNTPNGGQLSSYDGDSLSLKSSSTLDGVFTVECMVEHGDAVWASGLLQGSEGNTFNLFSTDPSTGSASLVQEGAKNDYSCVQTDGTQLYLAHEAELTSVSDDGAPGTSTPLGFSKVAGVANDDVWASGTQQGVLSTVPQKTTISFQQQQVVLSITTTPMNVWYTDGGGYLIVVTTP